MKKKHLPIKIREEIRNLNILVVGDLMLDRYIVGSVERLSPEAPVPIVNVIAEYSSLGGAGNTIKNISKLGAKTTCIGSVGRDSAGVEIQKYLKELGCTQLLFNSYKTTEKVRLIGSGVQVARYDMEMSEHVDPSTLNQFDFRSYDIIVISDYAKGMISDDLLGVILSKVEETLPIIIDPKPQNAWMYYGVADIITPNAKEIQQIRTDGKLNLKEIEHVVNTIGKEGMILYKDFGKEVINIKDEPVEVFNVTGAGDTVVATLAVTYALDYDIKTCCRIANKCARYVVSKEGTSFVPIDIFEGITSQVIGETKCY